MSWRQFSHCLATFCFLLIFDLLLFVVDRRLAPISHPIELFEIWFQKNTNTVLIYWWNVSRLKLSFLYCCFYNFRFYFPRSGISIFINRCSDDDRPVGNSHGQNLFVICWIVLLLMMIFTSCFYVLVWFGISIIVIRYFGGDCPDGNSSDRWLSVIFDLLFVDFNSCFYHSSAGKKYRLSLSVASMVVVLDGDFDASCICDIFIPYIIIHWLVLDFC